MGKSVLVPQFPTNQNATAESWGEVLNGIKDQITPRTVFVAHSLGCLATIRFVVQHSIQIDKACLVAGFSDLRLQKSVIKEKADHLNRVATPFLLTQKEKTDFNKFCQETICLYSDNDHLLPIQNLKKFADDIGAKHMFIKNKGHFSEGAGVFQIPQLLTILQH